MEGSGGRPISYLDYCELRWMTGIGIKKNKTSIKKKEERININIISE